MQVDLEKHLGEDSLSADIVTCLAHLQVVHRGGFLSINTPVISVDVLFLLQCWYCSWSVWCRIALQARIWYVSYWRTLLLYWSQVASSSERLPTLPPSGSGSFPTLLSGNSMWFEYAGVRTTFLFVHMILGMCLPGTSTRMPLKAQWKRDHLEQTANFRAWKLICTVSASKMTGTIDLSFLCCLNHGMGWNAGKHLWVMIHFCV